MNAPFAATPARPSAQVRTTFPEAFGEPHPRAVEMADAMLDIAAIGQGVGFKDLIRAGFTSAEIIEHNRDAERIAMARQVKRLDQPPDRLADMIAKAKAPAPNALPLPAGCGESQVLFIAWGRYCAARAAFLLDPWAGQRERALEVLRDYLDRLPLFPRERKAIIRAVHDVLARPGTPAESAEQ